MIFTYTPDLIQQRSHIQAIAVRVWNSKFETLFQWKPSCNGCNHDFLRPYLNW